MDTAVKKPSVLLADDLAEVLTHSARVLSGDFEVVGSVANGADLIEAAARLDPDVVVLDITMPGLDGIQAAARLRRAGCRAKLVFLSVHEDPDYAHGAMEAGGTAYVAKSELATHLVTAVHEALAGHPFVSPAISRESAI